MAGQLTACVSSKQQSIASNQRRAAGARSALGRPARGFQFYLMGSGLRQAARRFASLAASPHRPPPASSVAQRQRSGGAASTRPSDRSSSSSVLSAEQSFALSVQAAAELRGQPSPSRTGANCIDASQPADDDVQAQRRRGAERSAAQRRGKPGAAGGGEEILLTRSLHCSPGWMAYSQ